MRREGVGSGCERAKRAAASRKRASCDRGGDSRLPSCCVGHGCGRPGRLGRLFCSVRGKKNHKQVECLRRERDKGLLSSALWDPGATPSPSETLAPASHQLTPMGGPLCPCALWARDGGDPCTPQFEAYACLSLVPTPNLCPKLKTELGQQQTGAGVCRAPGWSCEEVGTAGGPQFVRSIGSWQDGMAVAPTHSHPLDPVPGPSAVPAKGCLAAAGPGDREA